MKLGCFSISLTVKDLKKSKEFYQKIGFAVFAGEEGPASFTVIDPDGNAILIDQHI